MSTNRPEPSDYPLPDGYHHEPLHDPDWRLEAQTHVAERLVVAVSEWSGGG